VPEPVNEDYFAVAAIVMRTLLQQPYTRAS